MDEAVVFDFDGTIADTDGLQSQAIQETMEAQCSIRIPMAEVNATFGYPLSERIRMLAEKRRIKADCIPLGFEANERLTKLMDKATFMPGARQSVDAMSKAGIRICIVSGNSEANINRFLQRTKMKNFEFVLGGERVSKKKPHPECYLKAAELLGLPAGKCVVVEDSPAGAMAARAARTRLIVVPNPLSKITDFPPTDAVLKSIKDVTPAFVRRLV